MGDILPLPPLIPDLGNLCLDVPTIPGLLCIPFPGGVELCAQTGYDFGDLSEVTRSLFSQVNSALLPLVPLFDLIDTVKAVFDCVQSVVKCLGPPPNPQKLVNCLKDLAKKIDKIIHMLPPFTIPPLVRAFIDAVIAALTALKMDLKALIDAALRILDAQTVAAKTGNLSLAGLLDCANDQLDAMIANKNAGLAPLNRLLGVINTLLEMAGMPCIPSLSGLAKPISLDMLKPIDMAIELLLFIRKLIPDLTFSLSGDDTPPCLPP